MKRLVSILSIFLLVSSIINAQNSQKDNQSDDLSKQMVQMQKQMAEQLKKLFGTEGGQDSSQMFDFSFKSMPFGQMDTAMTQSFGMLFDGKNWQNLSPNGDTSMHESLQQQRERMPDFGKGFNMDDLLKGFGNMFQNGYPMSPNTDDMPRVQPYDKRRKGDETKKNSKYKTESL